MITLPLYLSQPHPCSYLDDETASSVFVHPSIGLNSELYSSLLQLGFRRSGDQVYRAHCENCSACTAVRIPVNDFQPSRKQRRCLNLNSATEARIKTADFQEDHYRLYLDYQLARHGEGGMADSSRDDYMDFLSCPWCETWFVEFLLNQRLTAVAVVDNLDNALSAVYTFYDPTLAKYSPGVFAILWQIEKAKALKKDWLYLGYWIENCRKMRYKTEYRPLQGYMHEQWQWLKPRSI